MRDITSLGNGVNPVVSHCWVTVDGVKGYSNYSLMGTVHYLLLRRLYIKIHDDLRRNIKDFKRI